MTIPEELKRLRTEARELRKRTASVERARRMQKDRGDRLEEKVSEQQKTIRTLEEVNRALEEENETLKIQLGKVEDQAKKFAGMLFRPHRHRPEGDASNHRGVSAGHPGHGRRRPNRIDQRLRVFLTHCYRCGNPLDRTNSTDSRTVEDIPPPSIIVTQYEIERQWCGNCREEVRAIPQGTIPRMRFGLNTVILILALKYRLRTPLERIGEILHERYGLEITSGGIQAILHLLGTKFTPQYEKILMAIRTAPVKHGDETSFRIDGMNGWCWLFATPDAALYTIEETRGKGVPERILGPAPNGVLVRDDYPAYAALDMDQQSCWAHLLRVSHEAAVREAASGEVRDLHQELTDWYTELDADTRTPFNLSARQQRFVVHQKTLGTIIARTYGHTDARAVQTRITNQQTNLLTALLHEDVPLTNNHAERMIRPMVVTRKISGGSRSSKGAATHAVNMTIMQTLSLQGTSFFHGVREILTAANPRYALGTGE